MVLNEGTINILDACVVSAHRMLPAAFRILDTSE
jgi:hypothetical protein